MTDDQTTNGPATEDQTANGFGPKTWGRWSAFLVLPYGLFLVAALLTEGPSILRFLPALALVPLGFGASRTLNKQSGGLRLLSGAWGLNAGLALAPILAAYAGNSIVAPLFWLLAVMAVMGLTLTVLHKEK